MKIKQILLYIALPILMFGVLFFFINFNNSKNTQAAEKQYSLSPEFKEYWYQGKGEVNTYDLEQIRYGEVHDGEAVLVFVTESFSKSKQVKLDNPAEAGEDEVKVMKTNHIRRFATGIYDYSVMQSVFTPVDFEKYPNTLKVTTSVQDWCGHVFTQLNLRPYKYLLQTFSYFESEGDQEVQLEKAILEDELMNLIRIDPEELPEGSIEIIPSGIITRLKHYEPKIETARASLDKGEKQSVYELNYAASDRKLKITFENDFPHKIVSWEESYKENGHQLTTKATLRESMMTEYWNRHFNSDKKLRDQLKLQQQY